jgi:hypothetical protein
MEQRDGAEGEVSSTHDIIPEFDKGRTIEEEMVGVL